MTLLIERSASSHDAARLLAKSVILGFASGAGFGGVGTTFRTVKLDIQRRRTSQNRADYRGAALRGYVPDVDCNGGLTPTATCYRHFVAKL